MSAVEEFYALTPEQRRSVHFILCQNALNKWSAYAKSLDKIEYVESVVGTLQEVDKQLPFDSFETAKIGFDFRNVGERYPEPIVALQDNDLAFPDNIVFAYYAIYNLFKKYAENEAIDDWLIVNQALSSEMDSEAREPLLINAIQMTKR